MILAIALDDEPLALRILENFCNQRTDIKLLKLFNNQVEALSFLKEFPVDLLFLDIRMPGLSGIEISKQLNSGQQVIFTTAFTEYALDGFEVQAVDYLLKPYSLERFNQAVDRVQMFMKSRLDSDRGNPQYLFLRADYSLYKIALSEILFVEGLGDYLKIHKENQKTLVVRMTMKNIVDKLPSNDFIRVHRSFIVPLSRVESVRNHLIRLGKFEIPVGKKFEEELFSRVRN